MAWQAFNVQAAFATLRRVRRSTPNAFASRLSNFGTKMRERFWFDEVEQSFTMSETGLYHFNANVTSAE